MINFTAGFAIVAFILFFASQHSQISALLNLHSFVIVVLGSVAVFFIANPLSTMRCVFQTLNHFFRPKFSASSLGKVLIALCRDRKSDIGKTHPLIHYAKQLWEEGVDTDIFEALLFARLAELNSVSDRALSSMRNLAKYPPALGMTGTVIGLVSLFSKLTPDTKNLVGPNLALALTATLYGLVLANFLAMPIADLFQSVHLRSTQLNEYVYKTLLLIHHGEPEALVKGEARAA